MIIHHHHGSACVLNGRRAVIGTKKTNRWRSLRTNTTRESGRESERSPCLSGHMWRLLLWIHMRHGRNVTRACGSGGASVWSPASLVSHISTGVEPMCIPSLTAWRACGKRRGPVT